MDSHNTKKMAENGFNLAFLEAVDEGLLILGENARHLIYHILEKMYQVRRDQIPENPEALHKALEASVGSQAKVVEKLVAREFCSRLGLSFKGCEGLTLAETISYAKKHNQSTQLATLSQLLAQIRYLRTAVNVPEHWGTSVETSSEVRIPKERERAGPSIGPKSKTIIKDVMMEMLRAKGIDPQKTIMDSLAEPHHIPASPSERESVELQALSKALLESLKKDLLDTRNLKNSRSVRGP